jgi:hypothetical protein
VGALNIFASFFFFFKTGVLHYTIIGIYGGPQTNALTGCASKNNHLKIAPKRAMGAKVRI